MLVSEDAAGEPRRLLGLYRVLIARRVFDATLARAWPHTHASLGAPLIDRARAVITGCDIRLFDQHEHWKRQVGKVSAAPLSCQIKVPQPSPAK